MAATVVSSTITAETQGDGRINVVQIFALSDGREHVAVMNVAAGTDLRAFQTAQETLVDAKLVERETRETRGALVGRDAARLRTYLEGLNLVTLANMDVSTVEELVERI